MINRVGVVIPAHNEESLIVPCLDAMAVAIRAVRDLTVDVVLVLDDCADRTGSIAANYPWLTVIEIAARNVGRARAAGVAELLRRAHGRDPATLWLATTDADSVVPADWLCQHLAFAAAGWEVVVGTVSVSDWSEHDADVAQRWFDHYADVDEHQHVHGANFGCHANAYLEAGGWSPLAISEDVALLAAMTGRRILRTAALPVLTSARKAARAPMGFAEALRALAV